MSRASRGSRRLPGSDRLRAGAALTAAMAIAGSSVVVAKVIAADFPVFLANELRFLVASLVLVPIYYARNGGFRRFSRREGLVLFAQAFTGVFLFNVCLFYGVRLTSAAEAGIITSTTPAVVGLVAVVVLRERLTRTAAAGIGLAVVGVLAIEVLGGGASADRGSNPLLGNLLVLGATVGEALFTILGRAVSDGVSPLAITTVVSVLGCVMFLPFAAYDLASLDPASVRPTTLAAIGYYGLVVTVLAFVLWFRGVSEVPARTAGAFTGVLPVSAVVLSYLLLGERFRLSHPIGIACVLSGILLVSSTE